MREDQLAAQVRRFCRLPAEGPERLSLAQWTWGFYHYFGIRFAGLAAVSTLEWGVRGSAAPATELVLQLTGALRGSGYRKVGVESLESFRHQLLWMVEDLPQGGDRASNSHLQQCLAQSGLALVTLWRALWEPPNPLQQSVVRSTLLDMWVGALAMQGSPLQCGHLLPRIRVMAELAMSELIGSAELGDPLLALSLELSGSGEWRVLGTDPGTPDDPPSTEAAGPPRPW